MTPPLPQHLLFPQLPIPGFLHTLPTGIMMGLAAISLLLLAAASYCAMKKGE